MKLLTEELLAQLPPLYSSERNCDPKVIVHCFMAYSCYSAYFWEFDGEDTLFGAVSLGEGFELGYSSLEEIQSAKGPLGLSIERDLYFRQRPVSEIPALEDIRQYCVS